jgi:hypothetical protein
MAPLESSIQDLRRILTADPNAPDWRWQVRRHLSTVKEALSDRQARHWDAWLTARAHISNRDRRQLQARVAALAAEISRDFSGTEGLLLVGVLRGAFIFLADLARHLTVPHAVDFVATSHYGGGTTASGKVELVTDLRTDVGNFAQAGAPVMTLIAIHDLWISADMTENNLGNIDPGDKVAIVLDVMPGVVLKGRVRSVGGGVGTGQQSQPGTLPTIENSRDWLRQAQRIPVAVEFDPAELPRLKGARIGGQAEVLVYTGDNTVMNFFGAVYIRLMSWLSYLY